jgi:hypothetical protein
VSAYRIVTDNITLSDSATYEPWILSAPEGTVPVSAGIKTTSLGNGGGYANKYARLFESYPDGCDWKFTTLGDGSVALTATLYLICLTVFDVTPVECES